MKKHIILLGVIAMLSGCAVVPPTTQVIKDQEPILVGISMKEKLAVASKDINNQIDLLNRVKENRYAGSYNVVEHNNNVDARKGSSNTIPQAYAKDPLVNVSPVVNPNNIKKIDWKNSSLNELVQGFGKAAGYQVILVAASKDKNITFSVENENIFSALNRLKDYVKPFALITVVEKNKIIYLNYN